jgi:hypothetical protein
VCGRTFSETTGTALYGVKKGAELFVTVATLLAYGCPVKAIVMAFGLDERTVRDWLRQSGQHCRQVHEHMMETQAFDLIGQNLRTLFLSLGVCYQLTSLLLGVSACFFDKGLSFLLGLYR